MKHQDEMLEKAAIKYEFDRIFDKESMIINNRKYYSKQIQCKNCQRIISQGNIRHKYSYKCLEGFSRDATPLQPATPLQSEFYMNFPESFHRISN
jgi:hypothetical protein